jgi:hypothetical protein
MEYEIQYAIASMSGLFVGLGIGIFLIWRFKIRNSQKLQKWNLKKH